LEGVEGFEVGEYFVYQNGDRLELGMVLGPAPSGNYFCFYHSGETAASTPPWCMHRLENAYVIRDTSLGGERGRKVRDELG